MIKAEKHPVVLRHDDNGSCAGAEVRYGELSRAWVY